MKKHIIFIAVCYLIFAIVDVVFGEEIQWVKNAFIISAIIIGARSVDFKK